MGRLMMLQERDLDRIDCLQRRLRCRTKVDVVRSGLDLLEQSLEREARIVRWRRVVGMVTAESRRVNREFQPHSRLKRLP